MKAQKKLNVVLIILVIILISIISFVGIFHQNKNKMTSYIPEYDLGTDLEGYRRVILTLDDSDEGNTDDVKTHGNYVKSANIIKKRLDSMKIIDYSVRCDESTGQIEMTLPENIQTDYILADITQKGKFEIIDTSNNEVLMNNDDIRSVDVTAVPSSYSDSTAAYMNINFNGQGSKKFKNITKTYQNVIENETVSNEVENIAENTSTNEATNSTENETADDEEEEETSKEVSLKIDGTSMLTTTFTEVIDNGVMSLTLGSASNSSQLNILKYQAESLAAILENEVMPLQYTVTGNMYISSQIDNNDLNVLIYIGIALAVIIFIITIVKFKGKGLAVSIAQIGYIALYLLILRYTNVTMTLEGIFGIGLAFIINHVFSLIFLDNLTKQVEKSFEKAITKFGLVMIPVLIFSVVCCFSGWLKVFSFGMVVFWGLITSILYSLLITKPLIKSLSK